MKARVKAQSIHVSVTLVDKTHHDRKQDIIEIHQIPGRMLKIVQSREKRRTPSHFRRESRLAAVRRKRGWRQLQHSRPAATARVMRLDTALRGRSAARSDSGAAVENRARYTFIEPRCPTMSLIPGQPSAARAGETWSNRRRPVTSRAAKVETGFGSTTSN